MWVGKGESPQQNAMHEMLASQLRISEFVVLSFGGSRAVGR